MKALKFIDTAGNVYYIKSETLDNHSLVKASIGNIPYKGYVTTKFFEGYADLQLYLANHKDQVVIGQGNQAPVKVGDSRYNRVYTIEKV